MRITKEFPESNMRKKLKDCQNIQVRDYQHRQDYVEGDKVWFQPLNGNAWLGPALVVTQRGQSVYLHTHGDLKKIAACRVKPYELIHTEEHSSQNTQNTKEHTTPNTRKVMLEGGLEDIENMYTTKLNEYYYNAKKIGTHKYTHQELHYKQKCIQC